MKLIFASCLLSLILFQSADGFIWETEESVEDRLQRVPPLRVTAQKLMWYFLDRYDSPRRSSRIRRQANRVDYDVAFVIDSSGSITKNSFQSGLLALEMLIDRAQADTLYASVLYSTKADIQFTYVNAWRAKRQLKKLEYLRGWTNTQEALLKCRTDLIESKKSNARRGARKRLLIMTDGRSNIRSNLTLNRALQLKQQMVEIFVIAVGDYISGIHELVGLCSSTDAHLYRVRTYQDFVRVIKLIPKLNKEDTWLSDMYQGSRRNRDRKRHRHF